MYKNGVLSHYILFSNLGQQIIMILQPCLSINLNIIKKTVNIESFVFIKWKLENSFLQASEIWKNVFLIITRSPLLNYSCNVAKLFKYTDKNFFKIIFQIE